MNHQPSFISVFFYPIRYLGVIHNSPIPGLSGVAPVALTWITSKPETVNVPHPPGGIDSVRTRVPSPPLAVTPLKNCTTSGVGPQFLIAPEAKIPPQVPVEFAV